MRVPYPASAPAQWADRIIPLHLPLDALVLLLGVQLAADVFPVVENALVQMVPPQVHGFGVGRLLIAEDRRLDAKRLRVVRWC